MQNFIEEILIIAGSVVIYHVSAYLIPQLKPKKIARLLLSIVLTIIIMIIAFAD